MPVKLPYWSRDPFSHLTDEEKRKIKYIERESSERMKKVHPNGELALRVPKKLPGRIYEPESMTIRKDGRVYMDPHPEKMKPPKMNVIYRGRGRTWRLEREAQGFFVNIWVIILQTMMVCPIAIFRFERFIKKMVHFDDFVAIFRFERFLINGPGGRFCRDFSI